MRRNSFWADVLFIGVSLPALLVGVFLCGPLLFLLGLSVYLVFATGAGSAWDLLRHAWPMFATMVAAAAVAWWSLRNLFRQSKQG